MQAVGTVMTIRVIAPSPETRPREECHLVVPAGGAGVGFDTPWGYAIHGF